MSKVTFYRQRRRDGGTRTGIEFNDIEYWHRFDPGPDDNDPSLAWFIDVRVDGDGLPEDADSAYEWLIDETDTFSAALREFAQEIAPGLDSAQWPLIWSPAVAPPGVRIEIAVSATRRIDSRELSSVLIETADSWKEILTRLERMSGVT